MLHICYAWYDILTSSKETQYKKGLTPKSLWDDCGTATEGTKEIQDIFGSKVFDTPKPTAFIRRIIELEKQIAMLQAKIRKDGMK